MFRTLQFKKIMRFVGEDTYKVINDAELLTTILENANHYGIKIIKVNLNDWNYSTILIWGRKQYYLAFVHAFIKKYKNFIDNIEF